MDGGTWLVVPYPWACGQRVTSMKHDTDMEIKEGMTFHMMSWFTETGRGNYFISNTVLLGSSGTSYEGR